MLLNSYSQILVQALLSVLVFTSFFEQCNWEKVIQFHKKSSIGIFNCVTLALHSGTCITECKLKVFEVDLH